MATSARPTPYKVALGAPSFGLSIRDPTTLWREWVGLQAIASDDVTLLARNEDPKNDSDASGQPVASVRTRYADGWGAMKTAQAMAWFVTALSVVLVATTRADTTYTGTIIQRVTQTNDPSYSVGQVFYGSYQYTTPGGYVEFYTYNYEYPYPNVVVWSTLPGRDGPTPFEAATHAYLSTVDGTITNFFMVVGDEWRIFGIGSGGFYSNYERWMSDPPEDTIHTEGTVVISQPVRLGKVSDTGMTLLLVGASVLLLIPTLEHQVRVGRREAAASGSLPAVGGAATTIRSCADGRGRCGSFRRLRVESRGLKRPAAEKFDWSAGVPPAF